MDIYENIYWGDDYYIEKSLQNGDIRCYKFGYGVNMNKISKSELPKDLKDMVVKEEI